MSKFERKFGKYAIKNLSLILVICYAVGYLISMIRPLEPVLSFLTLNPYAICHGQVWRLVTWVLIPPYSFDLLTLVTLFFYYSIGRALERAWGDFRYNIYIFSGMLFTVVGSFLIWGYYALTTPNMTADQMSYLMQLVSMYFSTYYVNMSIFLAFSTTFPDVRVLLMFLIPVKVKWLGYLYGALLIYEFIFSSGVLRVVIAVSLLNFVLFFFLQRKNRFGSPQMRVKQAARRREFNNEVKRETKAPSISKHKCAICGRTEMDSPDLEFRFCSKCNGNYEYCSDHLFSHKHVE